MESYLGLYTERVLEFLPPAFFTTFWFLTIDSVYFPAKSYAEKIEDVKVRPRVFRKGSSKLVPAATTRKGTR